MNRLEKQKQFEKEFQEKAKQLHNDAYDYSKVVYVNSRTKVKIICSEHGEFEQLPSSHLQGNGCPKCARIWTDEHKLNHTESSRKSRGMTTEEWVQRAKQVHGSQYDYSQTEYVNRRTDVKIICKKHGLFEQKADSHLRGCGCRLCGLESEKRNFSREWSEEQRIKIRNTCRKKYNADRYLDSEVGKRHAHIIKSDPNYRKKMHDIISSEDVQQKIKATCLSKFGVDSAMKLPETIAKVGESKKHNGTWSTSKPEKKMYKILCDHFGKDDVHTQHKCSRYPFRCDFYIESLDLFIELNATWLHGKHWFDETNPQDIETLNLFKQKVAKGKRFYAIAIDVWTDRDLKKRQTAIDNHLNYLVFWNNDLSDFKKWLEADELLLNNIL